MVRTKEKINMLATRILVLENEVLKHDYFTLRHKVVDIEYELEKIQKKMYCLENGHGEKGVMGEQGGKYYFYCKNCMAKTGEAVITEKKKARR